MKVNEHTGKNEKQQHISSVDIARTLSFHHYTFINRRRNLNRQRSLKFQRTVMLKIFGHRIQRFRKHRCFTSALALAKIDRCYQRLTDVLSL